VSRVVGLDLSLSSTGAASVRSPLEGEDPIVRTWRFKYRAKQPRENAAVYAHLRMRYLIGSVSAVVSGADLCMIEDMPYGAKGSAVTGLAGLQWVIRHQVWHLGVPYVVVGPKQRAKWITGNGSAGKDECLAAAIKRFPDADLRGNDEADALTLAAMGAQHLGFPLVKMPASADEQLAKVAWLSREETMAWQESARRASSRPATGTASSR
jgi:crossover junction endodeoxyribonuclease RuvC